MKASDRAVVFRTVLDSTPIPTFPHFIIKVWSAGRCVHLAYVELFAAEWQELQRASAEQRAAFALRLQPFIQAAFENQGDSNERH